jgi:hypothetical protein
MGRVGEPEKHFFRDLSIFYKKSIENSIPTARAVRAFFEKNTIYFPGKVIYCKKSSDFCQNRKKALKKH